MYIFYNDVEDEDGTLICRVSGDGESQKMSVGRGNVLTVYNIEAPLTNRRKALDPYFKHSKIVKQLQSAQETVKPRPIKMKIKYSMTVPGNQIKSFIEEKIIPMENISYPTPAIKKTLFYLDNENSTKWSKKENVLNVEELSEVILSADPAKTPTGYRLKFAFANLNVPKDRVTEIRHQGHFNAKTATEHQQYGKPFFYLGGGGSVLYAHPINITVGSADGLIWEYLYEYERNNKSNPDGRIFCANTNSSQPDKDKSIFEVKGYDTDAQK